MPLIPVVTLGKPTTKTISDENGFRQCTCDFTADMDLYRWEARASLGESEPPRGVGTLVEQGNILLAGDRAVIEVNDLELKDGDGEYAISVYVQAMNGYWSDGTYERIRNGMNYNSKKKFNSILRYNGYPGPIVKRAVFFKFNSGKRFSESHKFNTKE